MPGHLGTWTEHGPALAEHGAEAVRDAFAVTLVTLYTSFRLAEHLAACGIAASIGTVGDALDNALMEATVGLPQPS